MYLIRYIPEKAAGVKRVSLMESVADRNMSGSCPARFMAFSERALTQLLALLFQVFFRWGRAYNI
jgi:hypothetical protein